MIETRITDATVVTMDDEHTIIENGGIAIDDGEIVAVGDASEIRETYDAETEITAEGRIILPGFINCHIHVPDILARGTKNERPLHEWLLSIKQPFVHAMDERDHEIAAALYCLESLRSGVTTFVENAGGTGVGYPMEIIETKLDVYETAGIRNIYAHGFLDRPQEAAFTEYLDRIRRKYPEIRHPEPALVETDEALSTIETLMERFHTAPEGRQSVWPAPYLAWGVTDEALVGAKRIAERHDTMTTTHTAETQLQERHLESSVERLSNAGYLGEHTLLGHGVHLTDRDIRLLAETETSVAHNVAANCTLGSGVARIPSLVGHGVTVGLGTDNASINDMIDMLQDLRLASLLHKATHEDPGAVSAETLLGMATIDAARAIGRGDDLGSLEAGKKADLVVLNTDHPRAVPYQDVTSQIVYQTTGRDVEAVFCDGECVVEDGRVERLEAAYPTLLEDAQTHADEIFERANIST